MRQPPAARKDTKTGSNGQGSGRTHLRIFAEISRTAGDAAKLAGMLAHVIRDPHRKALEPGELARAIRWLGCSRSTAYKWRLRLIDTGHLHQVQPRQLQLAYTPAELNYRHQADSWLEIPPAWYGWPLGRILAEHPDLQARSPARIAKRFGTTARTIQRWRAVQPPEPPAAADDPDVAWLLQQVPDFQGGDKSTHTIGSGGSRCDKCGPPGATNVDQEATNVDQNRDKCGPQ